MTTPYSIEAALVEWLGDLGYTASTNVPAHRPDRFVTVERESGGVDNLVDHPTVTVQTWALSRDEAETDGRDIRLLAETATREGTLPEGVYAMTANAGPYSFPDEDSDMPRYQTLYDITCAL